MEYVANVNLAGYYVIWIYFDGVPIPSAPFIVRAVCESDAPLQHGVRELRAIEYCTLVQYTCAERVEVRSELKQCTIE